MIEINEKSKCCACHACFNICPKNAIEMKEDEKGFKYPKIDKEKCVNCGLCEKVCPIITKKNRDNVPQIFACQNKDEEIRMNSSSGGIFYLIASEIIKRNGVVFGAVFDSEFSVIHKSAETLEEVKEIMTSKYLQSIIGDTYKKAKELLENDRYVLFTGTPCQIEGLLSYLGKDYEKLYTQDIVCHGVPSPKVWKKYLEYRKNKDNDDVLNINFRDKKQQGWKLFSLSFKYKNKEYAKNQKEDYFMKLFLKDVCLRDSCYKCSFRKKNRLSDITLADFWRIQNIVPELDDDKGTSLVLVNSKKGDELYKSILSNIESKEVTMDDALISNPAIIKSPKCNKYRDKFFKELDVNGNFDSLTKKYVKKPNIIQKCIKKIKKELKKIYKK